MEESEKEEKDRQSSESKKTPENEESGDNEKEKTDIDKTDIEVAEAVEEDAIDFEVTVDPTIVEKLSSGFLQKFLPTLEKSRSSLDEVLSSQKVLIETVEQENAKFTDCQAMGELTETMTKAKRYYNKLMAIKKDMAHLHEKSGKLKKRAVKVQQQRQKEELQKAQQKEREHEKERMLAARVAKPDS